MRRIVGRCGWRAWAIVLAACADAGPETTLEIAVPSSTEVMVGETLQLTATASGEVGVLGWSSGDSEIATVTAGLVEALRPGTAVIEVTAAGAVPDEIVLTVISRPGGYEAAEIDYFAEIAFGAEFGGATPLLRRWPTDAGPLIRINGSPSPVDLETVDSVVAEINRLTPLSIEVVDDAPTVELHFVPQEQFTGILPQAPDGNLGLVWIWWGADQHLFESVVLIATDATQDLRTHLIREELTQMLGLLRDSYLYPESIFYQGSSAVHQYLPIDRVVIELLYRPELTVGMTEQEASRVARRLLREEARRSAALSSVGGRQPGDGGSRGRPGSAGSGESGGEDVRRTAVRVPPAGPSPSAVLIGRWALNPPRSPPRSAPPGGNR